MARPIKKKKSTTQEWKKYLEIADNKHNMMGDLQSSSWPNVFLFVCLTGILINTPHSAHILS
jgi:hypothetical protein